jgi:hypothetical protein
VAWRSWQKDPRRLTCRSPLQSPLASFLWGFAHFDPSGLHVTLATCPGWLLLKSYGTGYLEVARFGFTAVRVAVVEKSPRLPVLQEPP